MYDKTILTLLQLEEFDPSAPVGGVERRFLCPLCGVDKPRDAAHRSLCVRSADGVWNCKRCTATGRLRENWMARPHRAIEARQRLQAAFSINSPIVSAVSWIEGAVIEESGQKGGQEAPKEPEPLVEKWRVVWERAGDLASETACKYLQARGIDWEVARASQVRFATDWHGRATLVFPLCDGAGEVVAIAGRCLKNGGVDKPSLGPKKNGAFWALAGEYAPLDTRLPSILVCEAPLDALSLAMAGFPALAFGGTSPPRWLARRCAFRGVVLALDADEAGEHASEKLAAVLSSFGSRCHRLRPEGAKDWNQMLLERGRDELSDWLAWQIFTVAK